MATRKNVKRKTVWRSLSIVDGSVDPATSNGEAAGMPADAADTASLSTGGRIAANSSDPSSHPSSTHANDASAAGTAETLRHRTTLAHRNDGRSKPYAACTAATTSSYNRHGNNSQQQHSTAYQSNASRPSSQRRLSAPSSQHGKPAPPNGDESPADATSTASTTAPRWTSAQHINASSGSNRTSYAQRVGGASSGENSGKPQPSSTYRRKPFNPRYYNGATRSTFRIHRTGESTEGSEIKSDSTAPKFNEDDYTRITTPRQDVLFKKGYLSRPRPQAVLPAHSEPLTASGVEEVVVLTAEEAIAAGLMHGYDPEHPYIGYYDATGMFYVNPYMNNGGVDPYTSQMMMMSYGAGDPYITDGQAPAMHGDETTSGVYGVPDVYTDPDNVAHVVLDPAFQYVPEQYADVSIAYEYSNEVDASTNAGLEEEPANVALAGESFAESAVIEEPSEIADDWNYGAGQSANDEQFADEVAIAEGAHLAEEDQLAAIETVTVLPDADGQQYYCPSESALELSESVTEADGASGLVVADGSSVMEAMTAAALNASAFYPPIFYPFVYGAPMPCVTPSGERSKYGGVRAKLAYIQSDAAATGAEADGQQVFGSSFDGGQGKFGRLRRRKRRTFRFSGSHGANNEFSEDDVDCSTAPSTEVNAILNRSAELALHQFVGNEQRSPTTPPPSPTPSLVRNTTLNVHVPEFRPRQRLDVRVNSQKCLDGQQGDRDSDDSGVSTGDVHASAPNSPEPESAAVFNDALQFPSIGTAADAVEPVAVPAAWSYAAMAQRTPVSLIKEPSIDGPTKEIKTKLSKKAPKANKTLKVKKSGMPVSEHITISTEKVVPVKTPKSELPVSEEKSSQLSFADLLRLSEASKASVITPTVEIIAVPIVKESIAVENIAAPSIDKESIIVPEKSVKQSLTKSSDKKPVAVEIPAEIIEEVETKSTVRTWQTIRVNGKKRMIEQIESEDFWAEPFEVPETTVQKRIEAVDDPKNQTIVLDIEKELSDTMTDTVTETPIQVKSNRKNKSKKANKNKLQVKDQKASKVSTEIVEPVADIVESLLEVEDDFAAVVAAAAAIDDVTDLTEYNFVTDPMAIFANAIAPSQSMFGGGRNIGGMFGAAKGFDFALKSQAEANASLRQEEDMVMRILRSISSVESTKSANEEIKGPEHSSTVSGVESTNSSTEDVGESATVSIEDAKESIQLSTDVIEESEKSSLNVVETLANPSEKSSAGEMDKSTTDGVKESMKLSFKNVESARHSSTEDVNKLVTDVSENMAESKTSLSVTETVINQALQYKSHDDVNAAEADKNTNKTESAFEMSPLFVNGHSDEKEYNLINLKSNAAITIDNNTNETANVNGHTKIEDFNATVELIETNIITDLLIKDVRPSDEITAIDMINSEIDQIPESKIEQTLTNIHDIQTNTKMLNVAESIQPTNPNELKSEHLNGNVPKGFKVDTNPVYLNGSRQKSANHDSKPLEIICPNGSIPLHRTNGHAKATEHEPQSIADATKMNGLTHQHNGSVNGHQHNGHQSNGIHAIRAAEVNGKRNAVDSLPTIGISSISHNGNTNGNTIESVLDDTIHVTHPLQISSAPDVVPTDIVATDVRPAPIVAVVVASHPICVDGDDGSVSKSAGTPSVSDLSDVASTLSSFGDDDDDRDVDSDDPDDRTVVGPLDEYIEDVMTDAIDDGDDGNLLGCGEFFARPHGSSPVDDICDPICDGDIDELIKHAELLVRGTSIDDSPSTPTDRNAERCWLPNGGPHITFSAVDIDADRSKLDRNESPRSSEDSGILDNHDDTAGTSANDESESDSAESSADVAKGKLMSCSLTEAVSNWLVEKQKEKSPEPLIRLPEDPVLSTQIEKSIQRFQISEMLKSYADDDDEDDDDDYDDYDDDDIDLKMLSSPNGVPAASVEPAKNSQGNPLPASSADRVDGQTGKRVAGTLMTKQVSVDDEPDILEYWDIDPMLTAQKRQNGSEAPSATDDNAKPSAGQQRPKAARVDYAQLLSEVGTRTTIDFLMSQQKRLANAEASTPVESPLASKADTAKAGEYLKRHQFKCALM